LESIAEERGGKKTQNKIKTKQEIQQLITYPTRTPLLLINPPPPSFFFFFFRFE